MHRGTFTKFFIGKGYGFIQSPELDGDVFAHAKDCLLPPGTYPVVGDQCTFDIAYGALGPRAFNIRIAVRAQPEEEVAAGEQPYVERRIGGVWRRDSGS
jgi:cold shock CspA family protein